MLPIIQICQFAVKLIKNPYYYLKQGSNELDVVRSSNQNLLEMLAPLVKESVYPFFRVRKCSLLTIGDGPTQGEYIIICTPFGAKFTFPFPS